MFSSVLVALAMSATPADKVGAQRQNAPSVDAVCGANFDRKFVHSVDKTPDGKTVPGLRLIAQPSALSHPPLVTSRPDGCLTYLTRFDLAR